MDITNLTRAQILKRDLPLEVLTGQSYVLIEAISHHYSPDFLRMQRFPVRPALLMMITFRQSPLAGRNEPPFRPDRAGTPVSTLCG